MNYWTLHSPPQGRDHFIIYTAKNREKMEKKWKNILQIAILTLKKPIGGLWLLYGQAIILNLYNIHKLLVIFYK